MIHLAQAPAALQPSTVPDVAGVVGLPGTTATPPPPAPRPRHVELDFVRLMAIVMMIQGHAIGTFVVADQIPTQGLAGDLYMRLRGLTSPTFLLVSGMVNFVGIRRDDRGRVLPHVLRSRVCRAVTLILVDYVLILPAGGVWGLFHLTSEQWFAFLRVGTLNIIGVSLLLATALMAVTRSDRALLAWSAGIGVAIAAVTPYVHDVDWFARLPPYVAHYLSLGGGGFFAIFPHTAFLFIGVASGGLAAHLLGAGRRWGFTVGCVAAGAAIVGLTAALYTRVNPLLVPHDYYTSSPFSVGERVGLALVLIGVWTAMFRAVAGADPGIARLSRRALYIYVAHVLLVFGGSWLWPFGRTWRGSLDLLPGIGAAALVIAISCGVGVAVMHLQDRRPAAWRYVRAGGLAVVAWLLLVGR